MPSFFESCIRSSKNFVEDFEHRLKIRNAQRRGESPAQIGLREIREQARIKFRGVRQNLGDFFEDRGFTGRQEARQTLGQRTAEGLMDLYEGMGALAQQSGQAVIRGARALREKFKKFWKWLGEVAKSCNDYVTEKAQRAINSAREGINNMVQMLSDISQGRGGRGAHQR